MPAPHPAAGILRGRCFLVSVEAGEIHAPHVAVFRRQRAAIGREPFHVLPRQREFHRPAAVAICIIVDRAVNVDGGSQARKRVLKISNAPSARMIDKADAVERNKFRARKFRVFSQAGFGEYVRPGEEHLVAGVEGVDLEFVVGVRPGDEQLHVGVLSDEIIVVRKLRANEQLLHAKENIQVLFDDVDDASLEFMNPKGDWKKEWPEKKSDGKEHARTLPVAIKLTLKTAQYGVLEQVFQVGDIVKKEKVPVESVQ